MVEPVRHRQTKGAGTDMCDLKPPRHIPTLPQPNKPPIPNQDRRLSRLRPSGYPDAREPRRETMAGGECD